MWAVLGGMPPTPSAQGADSPAELRRIGALRPAGSASVLGLRVNPQVGGGSIGAMSTATATRSSAWRCAIPAHARPS